MKVILWRDDVEVHEHWCDCGLCNSVNRKSYGVGIFKVPDDYDPNVIDYEGVNDLVNGECEERVYGGSEEAAMSNARYVAEQNGWHVL